MTSARNSASTGRQLRYTLPPPHALLMKAQHETRLCKVGYRAALALLIRLVLPRSLRAVAARDHLLPIARRARVATPARGCSRAPLPVAERAQVWLWIPPSAAPRGGRSERWKSQRLRACVRPLGNGRRSSQGQAPRPRRSAVWRTDSVGISEAQGTAAACVCCAARQKRAAAAVGLLSATAAEDEASGKGRGGRADASTHGHRASGRGGSPRSVCLRFDAP